ncbi:MAG: hypothetical protein AB8H86_32315 [Polyangiales bacterium]
MRSLSFALLLVMLAASSGLAQEEAAPDNYDPRGPAAMRTQEMDEGQAQSRFRIATAFYEEGRFLEAAREFEAAYELSRLASLKFNAYLAFRDAGRLADAVRCLSTYLEEAPDAAEHERLSGRLAAMRRTLAENNAENDAARVERERLEREAALERERANAAVQATTRINPTGYVVGALGVAMVLAGGGVGLLANSRYDALTADCPSGFCNRSIDIDERQGSLLRAQRATDALLYGGAAVTVTGIILILVLPDVTAADDVALRPNAACGANGCELSLGGSF